MATPAPDQEARDILARLYDDSDKIKNLCEDAGISAGSLYLEQSPADAWSTVVRQCTPNQRLKLLELASGRYSENASLHRVTQRMRDRCAEIEREGRSPDDKDATNEQVESFALRTRRFEQLYPGPTVGRDKDLQRLTNWLADSNAMCTRMLLEANAGFGKSKLLLTWRQSITTTHELIFVPISARAKTDRRADVQFILAWKLARALRVQAPAPEDGVELHRLFACRLIKRALPENKPIVVIIDGLDELQEAAPEELLEGFDVPGPNRLLVSARTLATDPRKSWLERLLWTDRDRTSYLTLERLDDEAIRSLFEQATLNLPASTIEMLVEHCAGSALTADALIREARLAPSIFDPANIKNWDRVASRALAPVFDGWKHRAKNLDEHEQAQDALGVLSVSFGPLSTDDIGELLDTPKRNSVSKAIDTLKSLLAPSEPSADRSSFVLAHPALGEYAQRELYSDREVDGFRRRFLSYGDRVVSALAANERVPRSQYIIRYWTRHLDNERDETDRFQRLLSPSWIEACGRAGENIGNAARDIELALRAFDRRARAEIEAGNNPMLVEESIRAELLACSLRNAARSIDPRLIGGALRTGLWSIDRALAAADALGGEDKTLEAAEEMTKIVQEEDVISLVAWIRGSNAEYSQALLLFELALHAPASHANSIAEEALARAIIAARRSRPSALPIIRKIVADFGIVPQQPTSRVSESEPQRAEIDALVAFAIAAGRLDRSRLSDDEQQQRVATAECEQALANESLRTFDWSSAVWAADIVQQLGPRDLPQRTEFTLGATSSRWIDERVVFAPFAYRLDGWSFVRHLAVLRETDAAALRGTLSQPMRPEDRLSTLVALACCSAIAHDSSLVDEVLEQEKTTRPDADGIAFFPSREIARTHVALQNTLQIARRSKRVELAEPALDCLVNDRRSPALDVANCLLERLERASATQDSDALSRFVSVLASSPQRIRSHLDGHRIHQLTRTLREREDPRWLSLAGMFGDAALVREALATRPAIGNDGVDDFARALRGLALPRWRGHETPEEPKERAGSIPTNSDTNPESAPLDTPPDDASEPTLTEACRDLLRSCSDEDALDRVEGWVSRTVEAPRETSPESEFRTAEDELAEAMFAVLETDELSNAIRDALVRVAAQVIPMTSGDLAISAAGVRMCRLVDLAPDRLLDELVDASAGTPDGCQALAMIAHRAQGSLRRRAISECLETLPWGIGGSSAAMSAYTVADIAPLLDDAQVSEALDSVIPNDWADDDYPAEWFNHRAYALAALAPKLSPSQLDRALRYAVHIQRPDELIDFDALSATAPLAERLSQMPMRELWPLWWATLIALSHHSRENMLRQLSRCTAVLDRVGADRERLRAIVDEISQRFP